MRYCLKLILLTFFWAFHSIKSNGQGKFEIAGTIPAKYNGTEIELSTDSHTFTTSKAIVKNGRFKFEGIIKEEFTHVYLAARMKNEYKKGWTFFITRGKMTIEVLTLEPNIPSQGGIRYFNVPFMNEQKVYDSILNKIEDSILLVNMQMRFIKSEQKNKRDSLTLLRENLKAQRLSRKIRFITSNADSYLSLFIFNQEVLNRPFINSSIGADSLFSIYNLFGTAIKKTKLGRSVLYYIQQKKSLGLNRILPDFSFSTDTGEEHLLSSFQSKNYVLLCFWDSYCGPCIKNIPLLKKLYEKYSDKGLQIISVSTDRDPARWLSSKRKYTMPWLQTCDIPTYIKGPPVRSLYDISFIPQYFLIDKGGRLIYQNVSSKDDENYNILKDTLNNIFNDY